VKFLDHQKVLKPASLQSPIEWQFHYGAPTWTSQSGMLDSIVWHVTFQKFNITLHYNYYYIITTQRNLYIN